MAGEDPALKRYRRFLSIFVLVGALVAASVGGYHLWRGRVFYAVLALFVVGFLVLLIHGYAADEAERNRPFPDDKGDGGEGR